MKEILLESPVDVEQALNRLAVLEADIQSQEADATKEIVDIRESVLGRIGKKEEEAKRLRVAIEDWASDKKNRKEFFPTGSKSLDLRAGTLSFRDSTPSLVLQKGWKTDDVLNELKQYIPEIRSAGIKQPEPTLDKNGIKKLFDKGIIGEFDLKTLGLKIEQDESFHITLNKLESYA
ncbi:MAG TPA: host-nuclease inhibitor Gam family protein [Candidatus Kapabacteria bacterium]|jgi:phage host-nuclease inhibitor protein Gam